MKLKAIITTIFVGTLMSQASLIINEGDSFTWNFDPEDFVFDGVDSEATPHPYSSWAITIDNAGSGEIFRISMYEDSLSDIPFYQKITTNSGSWGHAFATVDWTFNLKWEDKQGIIKVDAIEGSIGIQSARATTIVNDEYFTASIPEPSSVVLLTIGAGAIYLRRKRFPNRVRRSDYPLSPHHQASGSALGGSQGTTGTLCSNVRRRAYEEIIDTPEIDPSVYKALVEPVQQDNGVHALFRGNGVNRDGVGFRGIHLRDKH